MDWQNLLKATIRLADMYDLTRAPGQETFSIGAEDRRKSSDGQWYVLGTRLIEFLYLKDLGEPMAFHDVESFYKDFKVSDNTDFTFSDVKFMINLLSKEIELKSYDDDISYLHKSTTPLIEKKAYGFSCRITPNGIVSVGLAEGIENLLYGEQIARQIERALDLGDFDGYMKFADRLINTITTQSHDVLSLLEISGKNELREEYKKRGDLYTQTAEDIDGVIATIYVKIGTSEIEKELDSFLERNPDKSYYISLLPKKLGAISTALAGFKNKHLRLIAKFYHLQDNIIPIIDFHDLALSIASSIPSASAESLMSMYGFWGTMETGTAPAFDLYEKVKIKEKKLVTAPTFQTINTITLQDHFQQYIDENSHVIKDAIETAGYFSLCEAIQTDPTLCPKLCDFSALIGACLTPSKVADWTSPLVITVGNDRAEKIKLDGLTINYHDLILVEL